jgi:hypothetical protein
MCVCVKARDLASLLVSLRTKATHFSRSYLEETPEGRDVLNRGPWHTESVNNT